MSFRNGFDMNNLLGISFMSVIGFFLTWLQLSSHRFDLYNMYDLVEEEVRRISIRLSNIDLISHQLPGLDEDAFKQIVLEELKGTNLAFMPELILLQLHASTNDISYDLKSEVRRLSALFDAILSKVRLLKNRWKGVLKGNLRVLGEYLRKTPTTPTQIYNKARRMALEELKELDDDSIT